MTKLQPGDLDRIREQMAKTMSLREGDAQAKVTVHMGTCGIAAGAREVMHTILAELEKYGMKRDPAQPLPMTFDALMEDDAWEFEPTSSPRKTWNATRTSS